MKTLIRISCFVSLLYAVCMTLESSGVFASQTIEANDAMQVEIGKLSGDMSKEAALRVISKLNEMSQGDLAKVLPQVALYRARVKELFMANQLTSAEMELKMDGTIEVLRALASEHPDWRIRVVVAILPHLACSNSTVKTQVDWFLDKAEYSGRKQPDFSAYEVLLRQSAQDHPGLICYMYDRDPQTAILSMARLHADQATEVKLGATLKGDPKAALKSLANRPEWWARLYVAETMKKQPQLRDAAIIEKLEKDKHPLVRDAIAEIKSGQVQSK